MALKDIVIETSKVMLGQHSFSVHGLTLEIIMDLMAKGHRKEFEEAVDTIRKAVGDDLENAADTSNLIGALATTVRAAPELVARVIAGAADEPDEWEKVLKLPMSVQLDAIMAVGKLTFSGEDSVKKFIASLIELMMATRKTAIPAMQAASETLAGMKA